MEKVILKKKPSVYLSSALMIVLGLALVAIGVVGDALFMAAMGLVCIAMFAYLAWENSVFCATLDAEGVTLKKAFKGEQHWAYSQLELWLTLTPDNQPRGLVLCENARSIGVDIDKQNKTLTNIQPAWELVTKYMQPTRAFNNRGEVRLSTPEPPAQG